MGEGVTNPAEGNPHYTDPLSRLLHVALLLFGLIAAAVRLARRHRPPPMADADPPSSADSSFFTWDSGGQDYSFVHTAVELPKYPENAITEEERQMLLLYMQNGHPEVMLTPHQPSSEPSVRGFLETIVEETSDDLRSPSECDETSLGWGSWDESDEDRLTVVEMVTSDATKSAIDSGVLVFSDSKRNDNMDTLMSKPGVSPVSNSLDALWITPDALDSPESLDPWTNCEFKTPSDGLTSLDFTVNTSSVKTDNSLLVVGLDDLCLVPSKSELSQSEELMFSDNFKDYFLPASDHLTPSFNKDEAIEQGSLSTPDILSNIPEQKSLRCFRIGFESDPTEQVALSLLDDTHINADDLGNGSKISEDYSKLGPIIKSEADALNEEAMFSPVDGDIVYGSTWVSGRDVKEPEKNNASGAEVHCADDNLIPHHSASDDEAPKSEVPKSLSRWQHHSDLQHVQEATSPLARWQHHSGEPKPDKPAENSAEDESDDGLPPQLKEIYSSFKMKDNKMGRIRIKEDKNNNFKRLGLWDNESKVTLPPFKTSLIDPPINVTQKPIENGGGSREDLDDLEFDMFSTQGKSKPENNSKPPTNCDSDIDDALKSFNHLDDYSSQSDDCSEAENGAPFNVADLENALSAIAQCSGTTPIPEAGPSSLCSDTSDNSPLCTDTGFKNSVEDLLGLEHDILLPKTFPKMKTLAPQSNSDDSEQNADSLTKPSDSASPLTTTSDSDEGVRAVKEVKKRTKKRPKDSQSSELKHDDSGYVEDDEDDEEDDSLEKLMEKDSMPNADVVRTTRKSISTAYYESKSKQGEGFDSGLSSQIPCTYKEFSEQLEQSLCDEAEKWEIPENLSQFSAWLLDKELNKINKRDEVEKMMMNDIMKLREQTIADFLKNTSSAEQKIILNSAGLTTGRKILETIQEIETRNIRKDKTDLDDFIDPFVLRPKPIAFDISSSLDHEVKDEEDNHEDEEEKDSSHSSEDSSDNSDSDKGALTEEYYSYNVNSHVSSMFKEPDCDEANTIEETAKGCNNANSFTTIENNKEETFLASGHETETHAAAIGNAETPHGAVHHPPADSSSEPNLESTSIIGPAIPAAEILPPKVKDTTIIRTEKQNHGEAAEAPSGEPIQKVDDDSTRDDSTSDVATSGEEGEKHSEGADLMTPAWEEEKERGAEGISTVEGVASHVLSEEDSPHAHHCDVDSRANVNTDKDDCALNGIIIIADGVTEKVNSGGCEEVEGCVSTSPAELFTSVDCAVKALDGGNESLACGAFREEEVHEEDSSPLETDVKPSLDSDDKSDSDVTDKPVCVNIERRTDTEKRVSRTPGNFFGPIDCVNAPLTVPSGILSTTLEDLTQIAKPDLIVGCSEASDPDLPVLRNEYKRSNSLGREPEEPSFEPLTSQSKSTPDLRRCQPNSSAPLSALLSKSVSQRIHDYLGRSDRLNRSLPPSERSRHYRRICVSTHTVVEKAARFEARSKSTGPAAKPHEPPNGFFSKRSGSCPPNMRNSTWANNRSYNKPTATVKPTIGVKESQFELITGYEKATKVTHKPPVPPSPNVHQSLKSARLKGKIASARRDFFKRLSLAKSSVEVNRVQDDDDEEDEDEPGMGLSRFTAFRKSAREERARLAASHPDLGALEAAVRSSRRKIDQLRSESSVGPMPSTAVKGPYRRCTGEIAWASCAERLRAARAAAPPPQPLEIVDVRAHQPAAAIAAGCCGDFSRARSMDFLLDADNRDRVQPPENALAKARVKSEHELRIERSLQNLTIPDWYKQSAWSTKPKEGFILRRGSEGSGGESRKRWQGLGSSRTPSTTSLTSYSQRNIAVPKRVTVSTGDWRGSLVSSRESLTPASPASLSPRECSSAAFQYGLSSTSLSRWSSSRLSTSSAPLTALSVHRSFRQPYLGWRAAAASSSGGASPLNATTPVQGSSRPSSPRRGSQEQHFGYGLQQNQITSAATLRPDGSEAPDINRISPLALNTTNVFFNSHVEPPPPPQDDDPPRFPSTTEMRRDRYSYTQSLYSGSAAVLADDSDDRTNYNHPSQRDGGGTSPRVWMESSFVGTKRGEEEAPPPPRSIRIVPSTAAGGSTCATQTAMDTRELIDHLHNFLRGLQNRNQLIRPSSASAFTPVPSSSNSGFHQTTHDNTDEDDGSHSASTGMSQRHSLVEYDSEPRAYPRGNWRHSSSSSKDISPDNSSTDNELWLSVGERGFTPEHSSSISPPSPSRSHHPQQKRVSEDSTGRPIFFASSRRGSKGSDSKGSEPPPPPPTVLSPQQASRKSSSAHSEESGFFRRDSRSGGSNSWRDSSSASRGEKESSASMEEVLESLLAIPPTNSRSSSPTSPRRSKGPAFAPQQRLHEVLHHRNDEQDPEVLTRTELPEGASGQPRVVEDSADQGKMFADSLSFPQPFPSSSTSTTVAKHLPLCSPLEEVNHGSFCRSSSASPLEDDVQSPTSMEVLVPEGEEQELSSIVEGPAHKVEEEGHLKCHRPKCSKSLPVEEARAKFRTCPNCYTYYCSRQCRKLHLARHKEHCPQTRLSNLCKQVLLKAREDAVSRRHLSLCAKRGLLSRGRGAVKLLFLSPEDAHDYLLRGWEGAKGQTLYVSRADLLPQEMGSDVFSQVRSFCDKYNPERKFILLAAVGVAAGALEREVVVRGAKLHLSPALPEDDVQTLILTITKTVGEAPEEERRRGLDAVAAQLAARGVDVAALYPHTYRKMLKFVADGEPFAPVSIFPTDQRLGRVFMCIILPWADPDIIVNISSKGGAAKKKKWMS